MAIKNGFQVPPFAHYDLFPFDTLYLNFPLLLGQENDAFPPHFPTPMRAKFLSYPNLLHLKLIMLIALKEQYKP